MFSQQRNTKLYYGSALNLAKLELPLFRRSCCQGYFHFFGLFNVCSVSLNDLRYNLTRKNSFIKGNCCNLGQSFLAI